MCYIAGYISVIYNVFNGLGTMGDFYVFQAATRFFGDVRGLFDTFNGASRNGKNMAMLRRFLTGSKWLEPQVDSNITNELDEIKTIRFENVSFKYKADGELILKDINLTISKGEYIALVGLNGAGKSTLIKLLSGLYIPTSGTIYYNDIPHTALNLNDIRRVMSVISQHFKQYALSFRDNITFGDDSNSERFDKIVKALELETIVNSYDEGWDKLLMPNVYDGAANLSMGQWQKIAVARGLYKKAGMLIMDEPSSALDAYAENALFTAVREVNGYDVTLVVTHRLACVKDTSRIIVLENGKITEDGSHYELMNIDGTYRKLFTTQADKYK